MKLKIDESQYKIGMNEVEGLEAAILTAIKPLQNALKESMYWSSVEIEQAEYLSRDGFMAHDHNCGGLVIIEQVPECESIKFEWLEFGEPTEEELEDGNYNQDGELDATIRFWFKFEGIEDGQMKFYLNMSGGHGTYRYSDLPTLFETEFTAKTLKQVETRGLKAVQKLVKELKIGA